MRARRGDIVRQGNQAAGQAKSFTAGERRVIAHRDGARGGIGEADRQVANKIGRRRPKPKRRVRDGAAVVVHQNRSQARRLIHVKTGAGVG